VYGLSELRARAGVEGPTFHIPEVDYELPDGFRLWREGDDVRAAPVLPPQARHGLVGRFLELLEGETEAGPAVGATHSPSRHSSADAPSSPSDPTASTPTSRFVIGETSTGGKGSADTQVSPGRGRRSNFSRRRLRKVPAKHSSKRSPTRPAE
jgi:hypothetical protein